MASFKRHDGRRRAELRPARITASFVRSADGSCLIEIGNTRVICTASFVPGVPKWRQGSRLGWLTAEYGMLPASTSTRKSRPTTRLDGRGIEIQRIIGRVMRNAVRMDKLGENTIYLDCDVLEADGGTRTASITGAYVALALALAGGAERGLCARGALGGVVAAISVGIVDGQALLDLDYREDSLAEVDMNVAMTASGRIVELQGTGEGGSFSIDQLNELIRLARKGIGKLRKLQRQAINAGRRK